MTTFTTEDREAAVGSCGCGRSPTGKCIGWHSLTEDEYKNKKSDWEYQEYQRTAKKLWNDSCTSERAK